MNERAARQEEERASFCEKQREEQQRQQRIREERQARRPLVASCSRTEPLVDQPVQQG